jgi:hypothetical protein
MQPPFHITSAAPHYIRPKLRRKTDYQDHACLLLKVQRSTAEGRRLRAA